MQHIQMEQHFQMEQQQKYQLEDMTIHSQYLHQHLTAIMLQE